VIAQGGLALVLLVGAGLMVRSFQNLASQPLGFQTEHRLGFQIRVPDSEAGTADEVREYALGLHQRLMRVPGVVAVGMTDIPPLTVGMARAHNVRVPGSPEDEAVMTRALRASSGYFESAGIPLLAGSAFGGLDERDQGVIINHQLASDLFGESNPVGRELEHLAFSRTGEKTWEAMTVRAVVGSVRSTGARGEPRPVLYRSLSDSPSRTLGIVVQSAGARPGLESAVRTAVRAVNPAVAPYDISMLEMRARDLIATDEALAAVSSGFSAAAILLAALGLYGTMSQSVARRRREFGVRLALGALPGVLIRSVIGKGALMAVAAVGLGIPATLFGGRVLEARLFGIAPSDPVTIGLGSAFVIGVALIAAWIPARRIAAVDPRESLAAE
jgi:putative ABC transport system permease protein